METQEHLPAAHLPGPPRLRSTLAGWVLMGTGLFQPALEQARGDAERAAHYAQRQAQVQAPST